MQRRVAVVGGTSVVGRALVERLREAGHDVLVLSRRGEIAVDVTRPASLRGALDGRQTVYSLVGASLAPWPVFPRQTFEAIDRDGNLALLAEAEHAGVERFVYLSVFGDYPRPLAYVDAHRAVDRALEQASLSTTSVRPTGFFGSLAFLEQLRWLAPRIGDGTARTNPIHKLDLADVLAELVVNGPPVVDCGGPEVLTRSAITARLTGSARELPVPAGALAVQARLLRPFSPRLSAMIDFFATVLDHDAIAPKRGHRLLSRGGNPPPSL